MNLKPLLEKLKECENSIPKKNKLLVQGKLTRMMGHTLEAEGCVAPVGSLCNIINSSGSSAHAEVVGFSSDKLFLMPLDSHIDLEPGAKVIPTYEKPAFPASDNLLGRVIDGHARPLDGGLPIISKDKVTLYSAPKNPMLRQPISEPLDVGVKAINALMTVGKGQRMGLFAGSGVGKSTLLGIMTRFTKADVIVVGLVGERGREVQEFVQQSLGTEGLKRAVVVASPADNPPIVRLHTAMLATSYAEYYAEKGKNVLLLIDSLTRFAHAQRELALSIGEAPVTKGYPASVFTMIPELIERAGNSLSGNGSITAFYTALAEGDDQFDPIIDSSKAILDGHITLSRGLAESGHFPAIDIESSISRLMLQLADSSHLQAARLLRKYYSLYQANKDLITIGAYEKGSNPELDVAIEKLTLMMPFLQQELNEHVTFDKTIQDMMELFKENNKLQIQSDSMK